jgi:hypothetical protein
MSRYFNDFDAMNLQGGVIAHKAHKYVKKVKTKSGKTRYVYAKTVGSVGKNIATNPRKYGSAHMEELTPEELRRFSGKAHMDELVIDELGPKSGYKNYKKAVQHPDGDIFIYDKRYNTGRSGTRVTLSPKNGNITKDGKTLTQQGERVLYDTDRKIGMQYSEEDQAKAKKRYKKAEKRTKKEMAKMKKQMKKMGGL